MTNNKLSVTYALLAIILWSTSASAFKLALSYQNFIQVLAIATYASTLAIGLVILFQKNKAEILKLQRNVYFKSMLLGLLNPFLYYLILFNAFTLIPAQIAQPLNFIWPIVLVLMSAIVLKHKITYFNILGLLLSFAGVVVISSRGNFSTMFNGNLTGILLAMGSSIIWATYWLLNIQKVTDPTHSLFLNFICSSVYITIVLFVTHTQFPLNTPALLSGTYIGLFEMGFTFILWTKALNLAKSAARIGNMVYLTPFLSLICIHLVVKETIYYTTFAGLLLIIAGILTSTKRTSDNIE